MRRREFITGIASATTWPLVVHAQQGTRMWRVGALSSLNESDPREKAAYESFRKRLEELGWSVGRNLYIDHRWAKGDQNLISECGGTGSLETGRAALLLNSRSCG